MKDLLGKHIKANVYGTMYDGTVTNITDNTIVLEEDCGYSKLVKTLFINNIAAIEMRVPKNEK